MKYKVCLCVISIYGFFQIAELHSASLEITNDYQLKGISYPNLDFDTSVSTDARSFYSSRLRVSLVGKFAPGIEVHTRLQAIGVVGSTTTPTDFSWQREYPYPNINHVPFIENAYIKADNFGGYPVTIIIGRQPLEYGDGLIVSDNGSGLNALRFIMRHPQLYNLKTDVFTAKTIEKFTPSSDADITGVVVSFEPKKILFETGYFNEVDGSGSIYRLPSTRISPATKQIIKSFYDLRLRKPLIGGFYSVEYAIQKGKIISSTGEEYRLDGSACLLRGQLSSKKTNLGRFTANASLMTSSGDRMFAVTNNAEDRRFTPAYTKKYDGLTRSGLIGGEFMGITTYDTFWDNIWEYFSGFGFINLGAVFSPWYGWEFGTAYFLYSAADVNYFINEPFAPKSSNFEKLYLNQKFNLGIELNLSMKFIHSKYLDFKLLYARYTPPTFPDVWLNKEPSEYFLFETNCRF
ncbi:MAG: hypothetical protein ABIJ11_07360 [Elusimicrobiota bacterium]